MEYYKVLRVGLYERVSTLEQSTKGYSIETQKANLEEYCKDHNMKIVDHYTDEGISGTSVKNRDNFLRMIKKKKQGKLDLIVTKEISRFSRNTVDSIKYTEYLLKNGVIVYFLSDNLNTIQEDAEFRLTIMSSLAQDEVRKLSERVRFGMRRSIDSGVVLGCSNIYGYVKDKGKLIIDEKQAEMVRLIYDKYANTNVGLLKISKDLIASSAV